MENNKYLEEFKIDLVKQYLQGKQKKRHLRRIRGCKNDDMGMDVQVRSLIHKSWEVKGIEAAEEEYIDITMPLKEKHNSKTVILIEEGKRFSSLVFFSIFPFFSG